MQETRDPEASERSSVQLDLFYGSHIPRQLAIRELCGCRPEEAMRALDRDDRRVRPREWRALAELARSLAIALEEIAACASDPAAAARRWWSALAELVARELSWSGAAALELRRTFHARVLALVPEPLPAFFSDGTPSGWLVLRAGDPGRASALLSEAARLREHDAGVLSWLAEAHVESDRIDRARECYREVLYLDPASLAPARMTHSELRRFLEEYDGDPEWRLPRATIAGALPLAPVTTRFAGRLAQEAFDDLASSAITPLAKADRARLFYLGMVLGAPGLGGRPDLGRIRRAMKGADEELFEEYMAQRRLGERG